MGAVRQPSHDRFVIGEEADIGAARRALHRYAAALGVDHRLPQAELAATELGTNLIRHAKPGGWLLTRPVPPSGVELIAVDHGPGIADVAAVLAGAGSRRDTQPAQPGGGLGRGLAAAGRAATLLDVYSAPGQGTVALALVDLSRNPAPDGGPRAYAGVSVAVADACGDGWAATEVTGGLAVAIVDGTGHGPRASVATDAILAAFAEDPDDLDGFVDRAHRAARGTRGGCATVCRLDQAAAELHYVCVGNIAGRVLSNGPSRSLSFRYGALGAQVAAPRAATGCLPWPPGATLMLATDGLQSRIDVPAGAPLLRHDPGVIAAVLHRDHSREKDDATMVVVRHLEGGP